jgi:hypothetical protein
MSAFQKHTLAPVGSTGTTAGLPANSGLKVNAGDLSVAFLFTVEAVGATPTITYKFQGSDDGSNWFDVNYITDASDTPATAARTRTTQGQDIAWLSQSGVRQYNFYRVVVTANTNVTYRAELVAGTS